jgi:hypothetical protein
MLLLSAVYGTVFLALAKLHEFTKGNANPLREYVRLATLIIVLAFFVAWGADKLARYSAMADHLLHFLTVFVVAAVWMLVDAWRQLFGLFSKSGDERSIFTALLEIALPLSIASIFVPSVNGRIDSGLAKLAVFLVCLGLFSFILTGFRRQLGRLLPVSWKKSWVYYSWSFFGVLMCLITLALALSRAPHVFAQLAQWGGVWEATGKMLLGLLLNTDLLFRAFY